MVEVGGLIDQYRYKTTESGFDNKKWDEISAIAF
jgi:hypothetical protein